VNWIMGLQGSFVIFYCWYHLVNDCREGGGHAFGLVGPIFSTKEICTKCGKESWFSMICMG